MQKTTLHPSGIVAEIPEPVRSKIQAIRDSLGTLTAKLPVEITLAGSSGLGMIPARTDLSLIERQLDRVLSECYAFPVCFSAIRAFPNSPVVYLEPSDSTPFQQLHQLLAASGLPFSNIPWPYTPHCTLRARDPINEEALAEILRLDFPREEFLITTISLYHLDDSWLDCKLLSQRTLPTKKA